MRPGYPGNKLFGNEFANGEELFEPSFGTVLKWQLTANPQKEEKKARHLGAGRWWTALPLFAAPRTCWCGWATPAFCCAWRASRCSSTRCCFRRWACGSATPCPAAPEDVRGIDYLLLSHGHRDHLDEQSMQAAGARRTRSMQVLSSLRMAPLLRGMAPALPVQEAGWWQQYDLGPAAPLGNLLPARRPLAPPGPARHEQSAVGQLPDSDRTTSSSTSPATRPTPTISSRLSSGSAPSILS